MYATCNVHRLISPVMQKGMVSCVSLVPFHSKTKTNALVVVGAYVYDARATGSKELEMCHSSEPDILSHSSSRASQLFFCNVSSSSSGERKSLLCRSENCAEPFERVPVEPMEPDWSKMPSLGCRFRTMYYRCKKVEPYHFG